MGSAACFLNLFEKVWKKSNVSEWRVPYFSPKLRVSLCVPTRDTPAMLYISEYNIQKLWKSGYAFEIAVFAHEALRPFPFSAFCSYFYAPYPLILCVLSIFCNNLLLLYPAQSLQHCQFLLSLTALLHSLFAYTVCVPFNNKYQQRRFEIACVRLNSFEITLKTVWIHF